MSYVAASVAVTEAVTAIKFSDSEHTRPLDELCGFFYTVTPDTMRADLWGHADAPAVRCWSLHRPAGTAGSFEPAPGRARRLCGSVIAVALCSAANMAVFRSTLTSVKRQVLLPPTIIKLAG